MTGSRRAGALFGAAALASLAVGPTSGSPTCGDFFHPDEGRNTTWLQTVLPCYHASITEWSSPSSACFQTASGNCVTTGVGCEHPATPLIVLAFSPLSRARRRAASTHSLTQALWWSIAAYYIRPSTATVTVH